MLPIEACVCDFQDFGTGIDRLFFGAISDPSMLMTPEHDQVELYVASSVDGTGTLSLERWYHVVTTIGEAAAGDLHFFLTDGATGARAHIVPGAPQNRHDESSAPNVTIASGLRTHNFIGRSSPEDDGGLLSLTNVQMSGFRVWPVALSAGEVRTLAEGGSIGRQPLVHLPFDDQPGSGVARDASGNGRDGTVVGSVSTGSGAGGSCTPYSGASSLRIPEGYRMASRLCRSA
eukprot:tig00000113_g5623.t1